ncbi:hypothetical protein F4814DRAFT_400103 [Daldinia grandis]|nr:hypothetical protein F4814DRAFT_400103 [Daldinia grandis]
MAINAFYLFPCLPPEIRREVFLLATPPRMVHILQRQESIEDFLERFNNLVPWQVELHPSLSYFAQNWREQILSYKDIRSQRKLEFYGFTTSRLVQHPWEPSELTPEIPVHWLLEHPDVAYALLRKSYLRSKAPIPALLHTCVESRRVLINAGYQLAFASRNHEPWTWFNFKNDVLRLKDDEITTNLNLLDHGPWGTGTFDPRSLQQVRKLAIDAISPFLTSRSYENNPEEITLSTIRLLPNLKKIYIIEWDLLGFDDHFRQPSRPPTPSSPDADTIHDSVLYGREAWRFIPIEEIDALFLLTVQYPYKSFRTRSMGHGAWRLANFNGLPGEYFSYVSSYIKGYIRAGMDRAAKEEPITPYQVPEVEFGHICTEAVGRQLFDDRQEVWRQFELLRNRKEPFRSRPMSPTDLIWQDDWEAFYEANRPVRLDLPSVEYLLKHGKICRPRRELLLEP